MRNIAFLLVGIPFGIIMTKSEVISWFRIVEMFRFESIHMYGVIGTAVILGIIGMYILKTAGIKTLTGQEVKYTPMALNVKRHLIAGSLFGIGWAMTGACPGPMWVLLGNGYAIVIIYIIGALLGTYVYGVTKSPNT